MNQYRLNIVLTLASLLTVCAAHAQNQQTDTSRTAEESLNRFLYDYLRRDFFPDEPTGEPYFDAFVDLNGDGKKEAIVYLMGQGWCGSGGCKMIVLTPEASSYRVIVETTITRLPIRELSASSHGWHNLGVWVQGGGIRPGYEAEFRFDGKKYPSNPSTIPIRRLTGLQPGKVLIPRSAADAEAKKLEQPTVASSTQKLSLERFLQDYWRRLYLLDAPTNLRYFTSSIDLNGDGKNETVVYLVGPDWWITTLVLTPEASSYRVVGDIRFTRPPIRMLSGSSHGWRNLGAWVEGGRITTGYEAELPFDGKSYPMNPTVPPASHSEEQSSGEVIIPRTSVEADLKPLFPSDP